MIAEDFLNKKEDKVAAIEHVNKLFFTAQHLMTFFDERSNSEKIHVQKKMQ